MQEETIRPVKYRLLFWDCSAGAVKGEGASHPPGPTVDGEAPIRVFGQDAPFTEDYGLPMAFSTISKTLAGSNGLFTVATAFLMARWMPAKPLMTITGRLSNSFFWLNLR